MLCKRCGAVMKESERVCSQCGASVTESSESKKTEGGFMEKCKTFFNRSAGELMRKAFLLSGILFILQLVCFFLPFGEYEVFLVGREDLAKGGRINLATSSTGFGAFLAAVELFMMVIAMIQCFCAKPSKKVGGKKRAFLRLVALIYVVCIVFALITLSDQIRLNKENIEESYGSGELIDGSWKILIFGWLTILLAIIQVVVLFFATAKSKANNVALENSPEAKIAKYKKLRDEGVLTQEEFEEKTKECLKM